MKSLIDRFKLILSNPQVKMTLFIVWWVLRYHKWAIVLITLIIYCISSVICEHCYYESFLHFLYKFYYQFSLNYLYINPFNF